jgi:hypothetical protein
LILGLFCSDTPTLTCEEYKSRNIKRGKVVSVHTRKAHVACTVTAPVTLYLITICRSIASLIPLLLYPWGKKLEARWAPDILEKSDLCRLLGFKPPRSSSL